MCNSQHINLPWNNKDTRKKILHKTWLITLRVPFYLIDLHTFSNNTISEIYSIEFFSSERSYQTMTSHNTYTLVPEHDVMLPAAWLYTQPENVWAPPAKLCMYSYISSHSPFILSSARKNTSYDWCNLYVLRYID